MLKDEQKLQLCKCLFAAVCEKLIAPANADMDCDDDNSFGSVCEFSCNVGYTRMGAALTTCGGDNQNGPEWSHAVPVCLPG